MSTSHDNPDSAEITLPQDDLATRKTLAQYELKRKLGQGGMGAVYLAVDPLLKRQVALKILPREKASNPQLVKRFKAEAQNASQLTHENIVAVYGAGEADGYLYISLEFIDGIDVHDLVERRGVLPVKRSIDIIKQVCRALQHALEQGIVHRDIKPANLLVRRDGVVKLADMGLARAVDETTETGITRAGTTVGTVDYMSPEQARNSKAADVRSDMYSLGCTWYHMLTGTPPFAEGSLTNKLNAHANRPLPDARDKNPAVTEGVVAVMQRMMAKDPADRYQSPLELINDLEGALVNKDAVSRQILEAITDDFLQDDEADFVTGESSVNDSTPFPVNLQWSDATLPVPSGPPTAVEDLTPQHNDRKIGDTGTSEPRTDAAASGREKSGKETRLGAQPVASPAAAPGHSSARGSIPKSGKSKASLSDEARVGAPASKSTPGPDNNNKQFMSSGKPAPTPQKPDTVSNRAAAAKTIVRGGRSAPLTLPPPKRKGTDDQAEQSPSSLSGPVKLGLTILGVAAGLGVIVFLASLAERLGGAVAPIPIVVPVEQPLPPPPVQGGNEPPVPGSAVAAGLGSKDMLIERPDPSAQSDSSVQSASETVSASTGGSHIADQSRAFVPDWVDSPLPGDSVPMLNVRRGPGVAADRQYESLNDALKNVSGAGGRIVLFHDGPFELTPVEIAGGLVMIEAAQGTRPQIRLVAAGDHQKLPWLNVTGGILSLDGVDIIGDAAVVPVTDPWSWVRVTDGHLQVRRSSFTLKGKRSAPTVALKVAGALTEKTTLSSPSPRFLLDQCVIRGDGLQCMQLESTCFDVVVRNSLLVAGDAPAVTIRSTEKAQPQRLRQLRFLRSTVCSSQQGLVLSARGTGAPVETNLILSGTLFAAPPEANQAVLMSLEDWPATASGAPYKNLSWTAEASAILGFNSLLKLNSNAAATINEGAAWRKLWKEQSLTTISTVSWPSAMPAGILASPLKLWSPKSLESVALTFSVPEITPGCPVSDLRAPDFSTGAVASRPQRPQLPAPFVAKAIVRVDLVKTDLGKFMGSEDWEDGTVFVASGSGQKFSSPISVDSHRWRIQFQQTEGPTLVISPRGVVRSGGDNGAFISIRGGQLDIEHGSFHFDSKDPLSITPWFLYAEGGGFAFRNCRIVIPTSVAQRNRGIVRWAAPRSPEKAAGDQEFADYGVVSDSLLIGNNTLMSIDMSRRAVLLNNSAFIARQHLFELNVGMHDGRDSSAFDAQNCTYIVGGTQFAIKSEAPAGSGPLPCRMFHANTVFASLPHDSHAKVAPLLMNLVSHVQATDQVQWYEDSCGYGPELRVFFASQMALPTVPLAAQDFSVEWAKRWGPEHVQRPLLGSDGVLFEKNLGPNAIVVKPENLTLHNTAKARAWSETSGPIGARAQALEPPPSPQKMVPGSKKVTPKPSSQPKF